MCSQLAMLQWQFLCSECVQGHRISGFTLGEQGPAPSVEQVAKARPGVERLALIDRCIKDLVEEKMSLNELFTNPEYKFDDQFVLRIAELATMAKTREEQALFRGYMEEILKSKECADVTKRILQKITQGPGNNS